MHLKMSFNQASKGNQSMIDFLSYVKSIADQLHAIGCPVKNEDVILQILSSFPQEYSYVVTVMTAKKPLPSFLGLRSFLLAHEPHVLKSTPSSIENSQALLATRGHGNRGGSGQSN
ncbi:hypothetical protein ACH5RR_023899 [Cinchona calisaya]|uniref:Retrovirus-related Pol polyprotein from transposon TNT 1-94 n=1 Tax=Cinchona calisaya TaxID=153742 RepID=A0ABD2ZF35_9GENT